MNYRFIDTESVFQGQLTYRFCIQGRLIYYLREFIIAHLLLNKVNGNSSQSFNSRFNEISCFYWKYRTDALINKISPAFKGDPAIVFANQRVALIGEPMQDAPFPSETSLPFTCMVILQLTTSKKESGVGWWPKTKWLAEALSAMVSAIPDIPVFDSASYNFDGGQSEVNRLKYLLC
ncbi:MAG: hypothetical protein R2784_10190 [Saprospiraceae bacterium]